MNFYISYICLQLARILPYFCALLYFGVERAGEYSLFYLYLNFVKLLQLGVVNEMNRRVPIALGAGKNKQVFMLKTNAMAWCLYSVFLPLLIFETFIYLFNINNSILSKWVALSALPVAITQYYEMSAKSSSGFSKLANGQIVCTLLIIVGSIAAILLEVYEFLYFSYILAYVFYIVIIKDETPLKNALTFDWLVIRLMLIGGLKIITVALLSTLLLSVDRIFVKYFFDAQQLGLYSISIIIYGAFVLIPHGISQKMYAKLGGEYGAHKNIQEIIKKVFEISGWIVLLMSFLGVGAYVLCNIVIKLYIPEMVGAIDLLPVMIIGAVFYSCTVCMGIFYMISSRVNTIVNILIVSLVVVGVLLVILRHLKLGIYEVACVGAFGQVVYALLLSVGIKKCQN